jgi:hypothetical protein
LPVILYGHETWSLTLREEHRQRIFEKRVLRRIFALKRDEMVGGRRKLYNKEPHNLNFLPNINKITKVKGEMGRACSSYGGGRGECIQDFGAKARGVETIRKT